MFPTLAGLGLSQRSRERGGWMAGAPALRPHAAAWFGATSDWGIRTGAPAVPVSTPSLRGVPIGKSAHCPPLWLACRVLWVLDGSGLQRAGSFPSPPLLWAAGAWGTAAELSHPVSPPGPSTSAAGGQGQPQPAEPPPHAGPTTVDGGAELSSSCPRPARPGLGRLRTPLGSACHPGVWGAVSGCPWGGGAECPLPRCMVLGGRPVTFLCH